MVMELHITFGWHLDGPSYPESAAVGTLAVGPIGMLSQLCLRLGLTSTFPAQSVRIAEFMSRIGEQDDGAQFYSKSFKTDSWGTAKALLFLRDELMGSGWNPGFDTNDAPERLKTLSKLAYGDGSPERSRNLVCLGDMINPIFDRLKQIDRIGIDRITLIDEEILLPPVWQRLFSILREKHVIIESWIGSVSREIVRLVNQLD